MERLTFEGNFCDIAMCQDVPGGSFCENGACSQRKVWERLKAYEDTGLEPEEVNSVKLALMGKSVAEVKEFEGVPIDRLRELAQADKERSKGCPCCSGMTFLSGYFCGSGREKDGHVIRVYTQDTEDFNFCPMCGRSLKEESK